MDTLRQWMLVRVEDKATAHAWERLPHDFQVQAVQATYRQIKPHFDKRDIRARISASRARTFQELRWAVELMLYL